MPLLVFLNAECLAGCGGSAKGAVLSSEAFPVARGGSCSHSQETGEEQRVQDLRRGREEASGAAEGHAEGRNQRGL